MKAGVSKLSVIAALLLACRRLFPFISAFELFLSLNYSFHIKTIVTSVFLVKFALRIYLICLPNLYHSFLRREMFVNNAWKLGISALLGARRRGWDPYPRPPPHTESVWRNMGPLTKLLIKRRVIIFFRFFFLQYI